jgi:putative intracellular protease/amidase
MRIASLLMIASLLFPAAAFAAGETIYVCPMSEHPLEFSKPGQCPLCGMELVEKDKQLRVAVLIFDNVEDIDYTAPYEVFGQAGARLFTVAATTNVVHSVFGMHVQPAFDLDHAPASDIVLVPGGGVEDAMSNAKVIAWLQKRAATSRYIFSVCNGAFILAKAGLLDGLTATTTAGRIDQLATEFPKIRVVRERFVDNGKVITAAGLSAGIDGALHVIEREYGRVRAEEIARRIEYRWQPDVKWSRAAYADLMLPDVTLPKEALWEKIFSNGDTQQWEMRGRLRIGMTSDQLRDFASKEIEKRGWTPRDDKDAMTFIRKDREGIAWVTTVNLAADDAPSTYMVKMTVAKEK